MVAVIEADAHPPIVALRQRDQRSSSATVARRRLLDEHVLAGLDRGDGDRRQRVVGRRHDDDVDVAAERPRLPSDPTRRRLPPPVPERRRVRHRVGAGDQPARRRARPRACGRSGRSRRWRHREADSSIPPGEPAILRDDAAERVDVAALEILARAGSSSHGSHTALSSRPVMPSLAADPRNTASAAPVLERRLRPVLSC